MIEEDNEILQYVPHMNFSYFTDRLEQMQTKNFPNDTHHQCQKKWIQVIRKSGRASNIQVVIIFLYASKTYASHCRNILSSHFDKWKKNYQIRHQARNQWIKLSKCVVLQNQYQFFDGIRDQMHEIRSNRAANYLMSLEQYQSPNYGFFLKQVNDNQIDDSAVRIGYRKREKDGLCTTTTQTPREDGNDFEFENSDSSI